MNKKIKSFLKTAMISTILMFAAMNFNVMAAENNVYSLEKDGYWKPTDDIKHEFYINNIWGQQCYVDSIGFDRVSIKDVSTGKEYTEQQAKDMGFFDDEYNVTLLQGDKQLYSGSIGDLVDKDIKFDEPLLMNKDSKYNFTMDIKFNPLARNKYQDKQYEYKFTPTAFKIVEEIPSNTIMNMPRTGSIINSRVLTVIAICIVGTGISILVLKKKKGCVKDEK